MPSDTFPPDAGDQRDPDGLLELEAARDAILLETIPNVAFDGWSLTALRDGCRAAGYSPEMAVRAFPGGVIDAVEHAIDLADRTMLNALDKMDLPSMRVRDRIVTAIRTRLEQNAPDREAIRRAGAVLALPIHAPVAVRTLYRTVDTIWYAAGDRSTDFNFYTKRGLLAGIYTATLLYWLRDDSPGFGATWAFLHRRIEMVMRFGKATGQVSKAISRMPDPFGPIRALRAMAEQAGSGGAGRDTQGGGLGDLAAGLASGIGGRRRGSPFGTSGNPLDGLFAAVAGRRGWRSAADRYGRDRSDQAGPGASHADPAGAEDHRHGPGDAPD